MINSYENKDNLFIINNNYLKKFNVDLVLLPKKIFFSSKYKFISVESLPIYFDNKYEGKEENKKIIKIKEKIKKSIIRSFNSFIKDSFIGNNICIYLKYLYEGKTIMNKISKYEEFVHSLKQHKDVLDYNIENIKETINNYYK